MKKKQVKIYCYDYDNTLVATDYKIKKNNKSITTYDIVGEALFGEEEYNKGLKLFTDIEFEDGTEKDKWEPYNLPSKAKFYKFIAIANALTENKLTKEEITKASEKWIKNRYNNNSTDVLEKFNNFIDNIKSGKVISLMKQEAIKAIDKLIDNYKTKGNKLIFKLKKDNWNIWQFVRDDFDTEKLVKLLTEYKNNIELLQEKDITAQESVEKIFFPLSALYEIFGNEPVRINLDLMNKIINHKNDNNCIQCINTLKDKYSLIESMKIFKKIGNQHLKDFVKIFYDEDKKIDMIIGTTKNSSKRRKIRSLELLYYPQIKQFIQNKKKINYIIVGDGIDVKQDTNNNTFKALAGKDNYTLSNLFDINQKDLNDFKQLLKNEYNYQNIDKDQNIKNLNNLNKYLTNHILSEKLIIETRLTNEIKQNIKKINNICLNDINDDNLTVIKNKTNRTKIKNALKIIGQNKEIEKIMKTINKEMNTMKNQKFNIKDKRNNKNIKINFNFDKNSVRPLLKKSFKNIEKDRELFMAYNEFIKNKGYRKNNFNKYVFKNIKTRNFIDNKQLKNLKNYINKDKEKDKPNIVFTY